MFPSLIDIVTPVFLDELDEILQWLISILGGQLANDLCLSVTASRAEVLIFDLEFPLTGIYSDPLKILLIIPIDLKLKFSNLNNAIAFLFASPYTSYPEWLSSGVIGPGQMIIMSVKPSADQGPSIKFGDICSMFNVELLIAAKILTTALDLGFVIDGYL